MWGATSMIRRIARRSVALCSHSPPSDIFMISLACSKKVSYSFSGSCAHDEIFCKSCSHAVDADAERSQPVAGDCGVAGDAGDAGDEGGVPTAEDDAVELEVRGGAADAAN